MIAHRFQMIWHMHDGSRRERVVILVSKFGHCLNDLLHRYHTGSLPIEVPAVISNHDDMRSLVDWHRIPYHYLAVDKADRTSQERTLIRLLDDLDPDLVVLARYMQILSPRSVRPPGGPLHQHPPFVPAQLQRGQALSPGPCARRQADRCDGPLRHHRS